MITCPRCGCKINDDKAVFCPECDAIVNKEAEVFLSLNKKLEEEKNDPELAKRRRELREQRYSMREDHEEEYVHTPLYKEEKKNHAGLIITMVLVIALVAWVIFLR